ncbi:low molecular weight phosphotyrosine protein phosphatase 1 [Drosophila ficusphila]|uniref:low molecular weight phosphotyrosine protein phosphatase 1 n=1 Tax=Drosophila ficusphila TaxID=30025 RepID=UPI0007E5E9DD|nr:low molecular weight phosphotyrosine protein phosphatase 1 [Drosophila ficusphila]
MTYKKIVFVCMGNSCSSPMAEVIMQNLMDKTSLYWEVDSAGLRTWNTGRRPHKRCLQILREHGLRSDHFCRQLSANDFQYFDYIVAMEEAVYKELLLWASGNRDSRDCQVLLLSSFGKNGLPAFIESLSPTRKLKTFRSAYYQIKECCKQLILSQKVDIVKYELPSSEDDELYYANKERAERESVGPMPETSKHSNLFVLPAELRSSAGQISTSTNASCSQNLQNMGLVNFCNQGTQRKLCQKCGQKFLAAL